MSEKIRTAFSGGKTPAGKWKMECMLLLLLTAGFGLLYLSLCFNNNIWTDEAFTIDLLKNSGSYMDAVWFTAGDVHPPLYYLILKPFTDLFGIRLFLLKALSIVPVLLTMLLGITFVYRRFDVRTAFVYILMVGVLPCSMEYAVQVRMYSWALFFVTACGFYAVNCFERGKVTDWLILLLSGAAAAYTHYFAFAAVLWIYGFLFLALLWKRRRGLAGWGVCVVLSLLCYAPWMYVLKTQIGGVSDSYWIGEITPEVVLGYFDWLFETKLPYSTQMFEALLLLALAGTVYGLVRRKKGNTGGEGAAKEVCALLALLIPVLVAVTGIVVSNLLRPVFIARYLLPCIGLLAFFFGAAASRLKGRAYGALLIFLLLIGLLDYQKTWYAEYESTRVPETEQFFKENLGDNDLIVYNFKSFDFIYAYYFDPERLQYIEDVDLSRDYENIWLLDTHYNPEFPKEELERYGWHQYFIGNYGIEHDEFKIYRITKE